MEPGTLQKAYQWVLSYSLAQPSTYAVFTASHFPVPCAYSSIALPTPSFHWVGGHEHHAIPRHILLTGVSHLLIGLDNRVPTTSCH